MSIKVNNIILDIEESMEMLKIKVAKKLKIKTNDIKNMKIVKESVDARKKDSIKFNYAVQVECNNEDKIVSRCNSNDVTLSKEKYIPNINLGDKELPNRPIIVGMGPAGLFAGLIMAQKGYRPLIIERGEAVEERTKSIENFWNGVSTLNVNSNVQFGEGGAGTFSDGKLTTRIKDLRCGFILEEMVKHGAPDEILYKNKPHIGTDILKKVVVSIRKEILRLGGEVRFNSKLEDVDIEEEKIVSVIVNGEKIPCETLILAIGHSSRDTYEMLHKRGVLMTVKPFAIGVRVEHKQELIDRNQYGKFANHPRVRASEYKLTYTCKDKERSVYSFCMCPGGVVVAAASEEGMVVTNGMSYYARDKENANSAIVVSVGEKDFGTNPMDAIEFQRKYEELAFKVGGGDYYAPVQLIRDFMENKETTELGSVKPSYIPGYRFARMDECLPKEVVVAMREGLENFERKINGFTSGDGIMIGVETRTSAPVRIDRNDNLQSVNVEGIYPCGEGAGYAGGIISAAVDGVKCAEEIMKEWHFKA